MNRKTLLEKRIADIKSTVPLTTDEGVVLPHRVLALTLVEQLEVMLVCLNRFDEEIASLAPQHPDFGLFNGLPPARHTRHDCWSPSVSNVSALAMRLSCRNTPVSPQLPNAAASQPGSTGDGNVQPSYGRPLSGRHKRLTRLTGLACIIINSERKAARTRRL